MSDTPRTEALTYETCHVCEGSRRVPDPRDTLIAELTRFAQHQSWCRSHVAQPGTLYKPQACNCGLTAVLSRWVSG